MSITREIVLKVDSKQAQKGLDDTSKSLSKVGKESKKTGSSFGGMGKALKGVGIGVAIGGFAMLFDAFRNNQKASDLFARVMVRVNQVVSFFVDILIGALEVVDTLTLGLFNLSGAADTGTQALINQRNAVELLSSELEGTKLQYQTLAETQRQLRDDETASFEDRIAANEELGRILQEQLEVEKEGVMEIIKLREMELDYDSDNVQKKKELIEAQNMLLEIEERVNSQRSEQLTNEKSLIRERDQVRKEAYEKEMERVKKEKEEKQELFDAISKNLEDEKESLSILEQLEQAEKDYQAALLKTNQTVTGTRIQSTEEMIRLQEELNYLQDPANLEKYYDEVGRQEMDEFLKSNKRVNDHVTNMMDKFKGAFMINFFDEEGYQYHVDEITKVFFSIKQLKKYIDDEGDFTDQQIADILSKFGYQTAKGNILIHHTTRTAVRQLFEDFGKDHEHFIDTILDAEYDFKTRNLEITERAMKEDAALIIAALEEQDRIVTNHNKQVTNNEGAVQTERQDLLEEYNNTVLGLYAQAEEKVRLFRRDSMTVEIEEVMAQYKEVFKLAEHNAELTEALTEERENAVAEIIRKYAEEEQRIEEEKLQREADLRERDLQKRIEFAEYTRNTDKSEAELKLEEDLLTEENRFKELYAQYEGNYEKQEQLLEAHEKRKEDITKRYIKAERQMKLDAFQQIAGDAKDLFEQEAAAYKHLAAAETIIATYSAATKAMDFWKGSPIGIAQASVIALLGAKNLAKIYAVDTGDGGGSGSNGGISASGGGGAGAFNPIGGTVSTPLNVFGGGESNFPPVQAYVVENEITNSQALQNELDLQATL
jgi:hypothetical protein